MKPIFQCFEAVNGLKINLCKECDGGDGMFGGSYSSLCNMVNRSVRRFYFKYLGVLSANRRTNSLWDSLVETFGRRK